MFDIIRCEADPKKYGFVRFYQHEQVKGKIMGFGDVVAAAEAKNRKILATLSDYKFDEGAIKVIAEKKRLCFLIDLSAIIKSRGIGRAVGISKLRNFLRLCAKHGAFYAFASFAENEEEIRSPEELQHIAMLFGINQGQARFALMMLKDYF